MSGIEASNEGIYEKIAPFITDDSSTSTGTPEYLRIVRYDTRHLFALVRSGSLTKVTRPNIRVLDRTLRLIWCALIRWME